MNRFLQYFNFAGVLALACLCGLQWQANRRLNLEASRSEKFNLQQNAKLAEQEKIIKGVNADLDAFRDQVSGAAGRLKEAETKTSLAENNLRQIMVERDQLKSSMASWSEAVASRDKQLKEFESKIEALARERNDAVTKFNNLAEKYNGIVKELNETNAKLAAMATSRTNSIK